RLRVRPDGQQAVVSAVGVIAGPAKRCGVTAAHVVARRFAGQGPVELAVKAQLSDVAYADGFGSQVKQVQIFIECSGNVVPKVHHGVELENATAVDGVQIVVVQQIENHVLAQAWAHEAGQPHNKGAAKARLHEGFKHTAMQAVG